MQNVSITEVGREADAIVANLFGYYLHDMAEWFHFETDGAGRYVYDLQPHWAAGDRVFLARVDGELAGFALVGSAEHWLGDANAKDVVEFFVVRRHRGVGVGDQLAYAIWDAQRGPWLVRVFTGNRPAIPFWRRIIASYMSGTYVEEQRFHNGRDWAFFTFDNRRGPR